MHTSMLLYIYVCLCVHGQLEDGQYDTVMIIMIRTTSYENDDQGHTKNPSYDTIASRYIVVIMIISSSQ